MAKAAFSRLTDAETRKLGERKGLETPVVLALNACLLVVLSLDASRTGERRKLTR